MLTAKNYHDYMMLLDTLGNCVAIIHGQHDLKVGERLPVKSITLDGDKIHVEVDRPMSLVDAVGAYHGFSLNYSTNGDGKQKRELYNAWLREVEKGKT